MSSEKIGVDYIDKVDEMPSIAGSEKGDQKGFEDERVEGAPRVFGDELAAAVAKDPLNMRSWTSIKLLLMMMVSSLFF